MSLNLFLPWFSGSYASLQARCNCTGDMVRSNWNKRGGHAWMVWAFQFSCDLLTCNVAMLMFSNHKISKVFSSSHMSALFAYLRQNNQPRTPRLVSLCLCRGWSAAAASTLCGNWRTEWWWRRTWAPRAMRRARKCTAPRRCQEFNKF